MNDQGQAPDKTGWWIASVVVLILAAISLMDLENTSYSGLTATGNTDVTQVRADSPAEEAGFQAGDKILDNGGIDTSDLHALFRQPRAAIGETRHYQVEREGAEEPLHLSLTFTTLPPTLKALTLGAAVIGLAFLACGVGAYLRHPSATTRLLAFLGVAAMNAFVAPIYFSQPDLRLAAVVLPLVTSTLMPALFLHFLLRFPRRRPFLDRPISRWLIYGPVAVVGIVGAVTLLIRPQMLRLAIAVATAVPVLHILFAIGILIHSYVKADRAARASHGLNALLIGFVAGLVPLLVSGFVPSLPGAQFYFLTTILIPLALAYSALKTRGESPVELRPQAAPQPFDSMASRR